MIRFSQLKGLLETVVAVRWQQERILSNMIVQMINQI